MLRPGRTVIVDLRNDWIERGVALSLSVVKDFGGRLIVISSVGGPA
jgi:hypothetical protein